MAETIGQLALRIADGMPECCNDQNGWGRIYEFEPQELEAFARALGARNWPDWRTADPDKAICHVKEGGADPAAQGSA